MQLTPMQGYLGPKKWPQQGCSMQQGQVACLAAYNAMLGCLHHHLLRAPNVPWYRAIPVLIPLVEDGCERDPQSIVQHQTDDGLLGSSRDN